MLSPAVAASVRESPTRSGWIWGSRADLLWIVLCPLIAMGALQAVWAQHAFSDRNVYALMFCFIVNAHHLPASMRAFGEPAIYRRYKARLWTAWLLMPLVAMVPFSLGVGTAVLCVVALFDLWHVAMQQHGLGRIYGAKVGELDRRSARLDLACMLMWYATVVVWSDAWMAGIAEALRNAGLPLFATLSPAAWLAIKGLFGVASGTLLFAYVDNAVRNARRGAPIPWTKHALHGVTFGVLAFTYHDSNWYRAQSTVNLFHALQYFFIVWA